VPRNAPFTRPPEPSPTRASSEQIVAAILTAAVELGPNAPLAEIAERAGVSTASLHRYFPTTAALFAELSRLMYRNLLLQVREITARPDFDLRAVIRSVCTVAIAGPNVSLEYRRRLNLDIPLAWSREVAEENYAAVLGELADYYRRHMPSPPADLETRMFVAFGALRGAVWLSLLFPKLAPSNDQLINELTDTVMLALTR
jgi:AcrR family transcriptional regulator